MLRIYIIMPKELFYSHLRIIQDFLHEHQLWNEPVLIAISGGMDSVYLFKMLLHLEQQVALAHLNYQLRGEASEVDEEFVRTLGDQNNIKCFVKKIDMPQVLSKGGNMQILARNCRYEYFEELMQASAYKATVTAHHRKDQVETMIRNWIHGAGLNGLTGMPTKNNNIYRPILSIPEHEIKMVMDAQGWKWREDITNKEINYDRNYIRHEIIPALERLNFNVEERMMHTGKLLAEAQWVVEQYMNGFLKDHLIQNQHDTYTIKKSVLENHPALHTVIHAISKLFDFKESANSEIVKLIDSHVGSSIPLKNATIWNDREDLVFDLNTTFKQSQAIQITATAILEPQIIEFLNYNIEILCISEFSAELFYKPLKGRLYLNADHIVWPLTLRTWKEGDKMQPFGMKGYKKVSRIFIDEKVSNHEKSSQVLLADEKDILGILGLKMSEITRVIATTKKVLQINFSEKDV